MSLNFKLNEFYSSQFDKIVVISLLILTISMISCRDDDVLRSTIFDENNSNDINQTEIRIVTNPTTGRVWMDRNLGASRAATSLTDTQAFGDLYQWGRSADGHQKRSSLTTFILSITDQPGHGSFILSDYDADWNWHSHHVDNLWQGVNGKNNPCPIGFRIPTMAEWSAELDSWSSTNSSGAFNSPLKLPAGGFRSGSEGPFVRVGSYGIYWSSTVYGIAVWTLNIRSDGSGIGNFYPAYGISVRCIRD